ncbi:MAG: MBL fold metallo-hydrolase [Rikenellaceae bacterium]
MTIFIEQPSTTFRAMVTITSLVENTSTCGFRTAHGLSLYIETPRHRLLFDVGGDETFVENAQRLGIDLAAVDIVIISHGHRDHGGALARFIELNTTATIYIQRQAFAPHFSHRPTGVGDIGLDISLMTNERVVLLDSDFEIDEELILFKVVESSLCRSGANATLYEGDAPDRFCHEQNLAIRCDEPIVVMGCGHNGVVNILKRAAEFSPRLCVGGFHLTNPSARRDEPRELIDQIIQHLREFPDVEFYTCHCTGVDVYKYISSQMNTIHYLSCGESISCGGM